MQVVGAANAECRMQNAECRRSRSRAFHPSSFILHPSPRRGISLLEVLVSIFILSVGLLGVAALIPIGKLSLVETNISDRTGACGRAALREIKIRRLLDPNNWNSTPASTTFAIDPLGFNNGLTNNLGGASGTIARINLASGGAGWTPAQAESLFRWPDDLIVTLPKDMTTPQNGDRSSLQISGGVPQNEGNFSWFFTATPSPAEATLPLPQRRTYNVSVVVCHKRVFTDSGTDPGERVESVVCDMSPSPGGVGITLAGTQKLRDDQWILLTSGSQVSWYRVAAVGSVTGGNGNSMTRATLVGPDWNGSLGGTVTQSGGDVSISFDNSVNALIIGGVTGVYTSTITLDTDSLWNQ